MVSGGITVTGVIDGTNGENGFNNAVVQLFRRYAPTQANPTPALPTGTLTYTFSTGVLSGASANFNEWSQSIPDVSGNDGTKLFVTMATASSQGATDDIIVDSSATPPVNEWSTPVEYVADGMAYATITIYKRSATQPESSDKPDDRAKYYFKTVGSGLSQIKAYTLVAPEGGSLNGWSTDIPETDAHGNRTPCWVRRATAVAKNTDDYDEIQQGEWSDPAAKLVEDGEDGNGIVSITRTFARSNVGTTASEITEPAHDGNWTASSPAVNEQYPYLWAKEVVVFTDTTKNTTKYYCIGARGDNGVDAQDIEFVYVRTTQNVPPTIAEDTETPQGYKNDDYKPFAKVSSGRIKGGEANANTVVRCTDDPQGVDDTWQFEWEMKRTKGAAVNGHREWNNYTTGSAMTLHNNFAASAFIIDLDNDNDQFGADSESKVQATQERSTKVTLYDGATPQTLKTDGGLSVSLTYDDDTSVPNSVATYIATPSTGEVKVSILKNTNTEFSHDAIKALITATDTNNRSKSTVFTIRKILSGQPGLSPVIYQLNPTNKDFVFNRDASNNLIPASRLTTVNAIRTEGDSRRNASTSGDGVTYSWGFDNEAATQAHSGRSLGTSIEVSNTEANAHYQVWVELSTGDRETLPIVKDGAKGNDAHEVNPNILLRTIFDKGIDPVKEAWDADWDYVAVDTASSTITEGRKSIRISAYGLSTNKDFIQDVYSRLKPNTWYTLSFYSYSDYPWYTYIWPGTDSYACINTSLWFVDGVRITENVPINGGVNWPADWSGKRHTVTFKTSSSFPTNNVYIIFRAMAGGQVCICMPKLEVGDTATAYMPNEDDLKSSGVQYITVKGACKVGNSNPNDGQITICNGKDAPVTLTQDNMSPDSSSDNRRRGLALVTVDRYQMKFTNNDVKQFYDTCVSDRCTALANYINNNIGTNKFICLFSYDAIGWNDALINALKACGSSGIEHTETARRPFAFIGYKGLEQGYAMQLFGDVESNSTADVTAYIADGAMSTSKDGKDGQNAPYDIAWYARYTTRDANSQTGAPTGDSDTGWQSTAPAPTYSYPYIWQKIQHYNSSGQAEGSPSYTCLTGADGQPGQRGLTGRMYYIAGKWNETTQYSRTTDLCPVVYYKVGSGSSMIEWWYLTENNSTGDQPYDGSIKWAKVENFGVVLTEAIFVKEFAQFGACIITGDWLISIHGKLNNQSYAGTVENPETYNGLPAYTYFDPIFPLGTEASDNMLVKTVMATNLQKAAFGIYSSYAVDYQKVSDEIYRLRAGYYKFTAKIKVNNSNYRGFLRIMRDNWDTNYGVSTTSTNETEVELNQFIYLSEGNYYFQALVQYGGTLDEYTDVYEITDVSTVSSYYGNSQYVPLHRIAGKGQSNKPSPPSSYNPDDPGNDWTRGYPGSPGSNQSYWVVFGKIPSYQYAYYPQLTVTSVTFKVSDNSDRFVPNYAVDLRRGRSYQNDAYLKGLISATGGKIGGFEIGTDRLYNSNWNAGVDIDTNDGRSVKIGKNAQGVIDTESAIIRAENTRLNQTYNTALYLNAQKGEYNYALYGNGNGVLDGYMQGFKVKVLKNIGAATNLLLNEGQIQAVESIAIDGDKYLYLPTLGNCRQTLGLKNSVDDAGRDFCCTMTIINQTAVQTGTILGNRDNVYIKGGDHDYTDIIESSFARPVVLARGDSKKIGIENCSTCYVVITYISKRFIANYIKTTW